MIRDELEYAAALVRIELLWDAKSGSPEAKEFIRLAEDVDAFESVHHSIPKPSAEAASEFRKDQERKQ